VQLLPTAPVDVQRGTLPLLLLLDSDPAYQVCFCVCVYICATHGKRPLTATTSRARCAQRRVVAAHGLRTALAAALRARDRALRDLFVSAAAPRARARRVSEQFSRRVVSRRSPRLLPKK
jgi:hypothetical protein